MTSTASATQETGGWALVTGASAGIGAEFCRQLADRGYSLVLVARRADRLEQLAGKLSAQYPVECRVYALDLAREGASAELADWLAAEQLPIEFLVNNAGYGLAGHFTTPSWQQHRDFIQLMMTAVCELSWRLLPGMQQRHKGYIINVASLAGLVPGSAGHTLYGASKSFLVGFSQSLALENLPRGVHVSALCPGFTWSEFHDVSGTRELVSKMPGWMWMQADEVVRYGIDAVLRNPPRVVAIPGRVNRTIARTVRWLPMSVSLWLTRRMSGRFRARDRGH